MSNFAGSVTSEKNGAGGQKFQNIVVSVGYLSVKASVGNPPGEGERGSCGFVKSKSNQIKSGKKKVFDDLQIATWERLPTPPTLAPASSCLFNPALLLSLAKFLNSQQQ